MLTAPRPAGFDALDTPLSEVTFVVLDLETTGASPRDCSITEVGAVKVRGGACLGTFDTLVNPGVPLPDLITVLTGITEAMVIPAPPIEEVLPPLLEFIGGAVIVGHNIRFDISFLDAALTTHGYATLAQRRVDTIGLARRLVRDEVADLKLGTLARHLRVSVEPCHRAFADAAATTEVLHALLERAGTFGVLGLDDLLAVSSIRAHPTASKLKLTARLPRCPGVYLMKDRGGRVRYVGEATNLRTAVRAHFAGDGSRIVPQLVKETAAVEWIECGHELEAGLRAVRLVHELRPRFNESPGRQRSAAYVKLGTASRHPRLQVVRSVKGDAALYLGPFPSTRAAQVIRGAIESAVPIRRCVTPVGPTGTHRPGPRCRPTVTDVAGCPCHAEAAVVPEVAVETVVRGLRGEPYLLLGPLERSVRVLAEADHFEAAACARDQLVALRRALRRFRTLEWLATSGRMTVATAGGVMAFENGRLLVGGDADGSAAPETDGPGEPTGPAPHLDPLHAGELLCVARWLDRELSAGRARFLDPARAETVPFAALDR